MRRWLAVTGIVAMATMSGVASSANAASPQPASTLFARATRVGDELALLGQSSGPFGLPRGLRVSELRFTNHDGYAISVVAYGQTVALSVSSHARRRGRPAARSSTTTYLAHGKVTPTSIQASFADRGRIAVRFRPTGRKIRASGKAGCNRPSADVIADLGLFVGALRFHGEGAYTSVEAHRVHGGSVHLAALVGCLVGSPSQRDALSPTSVLPAFGVVAHLHRAGAAPPEVPTHPSRGPKRTTLFADLKLPLSRTMFGAQVRGEGRPRFLAVKESSEGSIATIRIANALGSPPAFTFESTLAGATVAPPLPFHGQGDLVQGLGAAKSWIGSLDVSFLGAPRFPLTGEPFRAQLVQSW